MHIRTLVWVVLLASSLLAFAALAQDVPGRDAPPAPPRRALMLAQLCAHEAGWDADETGDCAAIHEVIRRGALREGMAYEAFMRTYSRRLFTGLVARRYFLELDARGGTPPSWPSIRTVRAREGEDVRVERVPPFSAYRRQWLDLLAYAARIVDHAPEDVSPCQSPVHDWGGSMDRERAARIGLIEVDCGATRNDFYARPSLVE